jgi:hypothetical protein
MANARADVNAWIQRVERKQFRHRVSVPVRLEFANGQSLADAVSIQTLQTALERFVAEGMVGSSGKLYTEFHERSNQGREFYPKYMAPGGEGESTSVQAESYGDVEHARRRTRRGSRGRKERTATGHMREGFTDLWGALSRTARITTGGLLGVGVGPGDAVMGLRLHDYMRTQGSHAGKRREFDSLFYAVEFGTGVERNVGGPQWVRKDGPTKERYGRGPEGSWWFGREASPGVFTGKLMTGQRGFHFLYEHRTRKPDDIYEHYVKEHLPRYIYAALGIRGG